MVKARPVYLNLVAIRQPLPAIVSILHRISGVLLFLVGIPLVLLVVAASRGTAQEFDIARGWFGSPLAKLVVLAMVWAYLHHFCAGIRYLLLDMDLGGDLEPARRSSVIVLFVSLALTVGVGARLW
ncbi:MAG: succinate dehydrogenase, cytochrome b556 subunit [Casimicrobiaceae bacterium]